MGIKIAKTTLKLAVIVILDIGVFIGWAASMFLLSPVHYVIYLVLKLFISEEFLTSPNFQGNIYPLFILPFIFVINFLYFKRIKLKISSKINLFTDFIFRIAISTFPIVIMLLLIFWLPGLGERSQINREVEGFSVTDQPSFSVQTDNENIVLNIDFPVRFETEFTGTWVDHYFDVKFSPNNEEAVSKLRNCKLRFSNFSHHNLDSDSRNKIGAGNYDLRYSFTFYRAGCSVDDLSHLIGKDIEFLNIRKGESNSQVLYSFPITSFDLTPSLLN